MKRHSIVPRPNWQKTIFDQGLVYLSDPANPAPGDQDNQTPWQEDAAWEFTRDEIVKMETVTEELFQMCLSAVDVCVKSTQLMPRMGLSEETQQAVIESWEQRHPTLYSRFDLALDRASGEYKMVEINGDTPTGLVESALTQWFWLKDVHPRLADADEPGQFNSLHEKLLARWTEIVQMLPANDLSAVFSTRTDYLDDVLTTEYLRDLATQAGFETHLCDIRDVTLWTNPDGSTLFGTPDKQVLRTWFKLYPWEWLLSDEFGSDLLRKTREIRIVEPAWKIFLTNKMILPILWALFPDHPNLVPAFFDKDPSLGDRYVEKPQYGRESTGVKLFDQGQVITSDADTANPLSNLPPIYQALIDVESQDGYYPLFGSWVVKDQAAGLMLREDKSRIVSGGSRIVPHFYR